jgi:hypothetical protein
MRTLSALGLGLVVALFAAGCQRKINQEGKFTVPTGGSSALQIPGPKTEEAVTVAINATGSPVDVYVLFADSPDAANKIAEENSLMSGATLKHALAGKQKVQEASFDVTIPANKSFVVLMVNNVNNQRAAEVKVKVTGK